MYKWIFIKDIGVHSSLCVCVCVSVSVFAVVVVVVCMGSASGLYWLSTKVIFYFHVSQIKFSELVALRGLVKESKSYILM